MKDSPTIRSYKDAIQSINNLLAGLQTEYRYEDLSNWKEYAKSMRNLWLGLVQSFSVSVWLFGVIMTAIEAGIVEKHT
jgi:hypothetical protein